LPAITVNVAVIHEHQILLTKRNDFEIWCLPSGGVEDGESLAQAAIRETKEETGLEVELTSLVGVYSRTGGLWNMHAVLFSAVPTGGRIQTQPGETIEVRYFPFDALPEDLSFGHKQRIDDAIAGIGGSVAVHQEMIVPPGYQISQNDIIEIRKQPRQSRLEFYRKTIGQARLRTTIDVEAKQREV
jgi:8-oxo-dGTP diphosphatase